MKKILCIRIDSSPIPKEANEVVCLDCNLEYYFCSFLGRVLLKTTSSVGDFKYPGELLTDFAKYNKEDYRSIIKQWEKVISHLINKVYNEDDNLTILLPSSFCNWLYQHENVCFQEIGRNLNAYLSILCDMESLYNEIIVNFLIKKVTFFLKKNREEIEYISLPFPLYSGNCIEDIYLQFETPYIGIRNGWNKNVFNGLGNAKYDFHDGFTRYDSGGWLTFIDNQGKFCQHSLSELFFDTHDYSEGLAAVQHGNKWGFIDDKGRNIIPCKYEEVGDFLNGMARVKSNGKWGFVNKQGREKIECKYDFAADFSGYPAPLELALVEEDSDLYFIDKDDNIHVLCDSHESYFSFHEGLAGVEKNNKYGFINMFGEEQIPCKYEETSYFSEGIVCVKYMNKWGYIDKDGQVVTPCIYDEAYPLTEAIALVCRQGKYGYINRKGEITIPFIYEDACSYSDGLACVKKGDKWGYINKYNNEIIPFIYNDAFPFSDGMARVQLHSEAEYDYINKHWFVK